MSSPSSTSSAEPPEHEQIARYDQDAQNLTPSQAAASTIAGSYRPRDEGAPTEIGSLYSYNSSRDLSQFVKESGGRYYHTQSAGYFLPTGQRLVPFDGGDWAG
jgi:hypothetical protein